MKVNIQKIAKRIFPIFCAFCFTIACIVFKASAANIEIVNFQNYMTIIDTAVDEFTVKVTLSPADFPVRWNLYDGNWNEIDSLVASSGELQDQRPSIGHLILKYYPTGYNAYLDLSYIPTGTLITLSFDGGLTDGGHGAIYDTTNLRSGVALKYYDENFKSIGSTVYNYIDSTSAYSLNGTFSLDKPEGAMYVRIDNLWRDFQPDTPSIFVNASDLVLKFTLPMSVIDQVDNDVTNDLLRSILESLTGDYGGVGNQASGEMGQAVGGLDSVGQALDNVNKPSIDIGLITPDDIKSDTYLKYTALISIFWSCPVLISMCGILVSLILISYVFHGKKG